MTLTNGWKGSIGEISVPPVWSKISNALKRLGFRSHNFLTQLLSETSRACTIRVRRSSLGGLWNDLGSHAGLHHRNRRPGTSPEERISGRRELDPESPNPRQDVVIGCRKSYVGGDRPPARTESLGRIGGGRQTGYAAGLVPKAHRRQVRRIRSFANPGVVPEWTRKPSGWWCGWRKKIPGGALTGSWAPWPTWVCGSRIRR